MAELLKVLDMSEDEQYWWLCNHYQDYQYKIDLYPKNDDVKKKELADLAFRLRGEAKEIKKVQEDMIFPIAWLKACYQVIHRKEVDCYARVIDAEEAEYEVLKREPIVWIISALIAKGKEDDRQS